MEPGAVPAVCRGPRPAVELSTPAKKWILDAHDHHHCSRPLAPPRHSSRDDRRGGHDGARRGGLRRHPDQGARADLSRRPGDGELVPGLTGERPGDGPARRGGWGYPAHPRVVVACRRTRARAALPSRGAVESHRAAFPHPATARLRLFGAGGRLPRLRQERRRRSLRGDGLRGRRGGVAAIDRARARSLAPLHLRAFAGWRRGDRSRRSLERRMHPPLPGGWSSSRRLRRSPTWRGSSPGRGSRCNCC
jgi:hypothetical protein